MPIQEALMRVHAEIVPKLSPTAIRRPADVSCAERKTRHHVEVGHELYWRKWWRKTQISIQLWQIDVTCISWDPNTASRYTYHWGWKIHGVMISIVNAKIHRVVHGGYRNEWRFCNITYHRTSPTSRNSVNGEGIDYPLSENIHALDYMIGHIPGILTWYSDLEGCRGEVVSESSS